MEQQFAIYLVYTALAAALDLGVGWVIIPWLILDGSPRLMQYIFSTFGLASLQEFDPNYDSNAESAEWLNNSIKFFWNDALRQTIKDTCQRTLSSIWRLKVVKFDICSTDSPLHLKTIKSQATRNSLSIDFGIMTNISANIQLSWLVSWLRFGMNHFQMQGIIRVQFEQLIHNDPRLFRTLQVSFLHPPKFDYTFNGLASILNIMKPIVRFIVNKILVFPKAITMKNSMLKDVKENLPNQWNTSPVVGILSVTVTPTQPGDDEKLCGCFGLFSPLAILELGNHRAKAKIDSSLELSKQFPILANMKEFVLRSSKASFTKKCTIGNQVDKVLAIPLTKLQCFNGCVNMHGKRLHIQTSINSSLASRPILSILIIESSSSPRSIKPLVTLQMSGQSDYQHTSAGLQSQKWQFHQEFAFIVDYMKTDQLTLGLADYHDCQSVIRKDVAPKLEFMMSNEDLAEDDIICASSQIKKRAKFQLRICDLRINEDQVHEVDLQTEPRVKGNYRLVFVSNLRICQ